MLIVNGLLATIVITLLSLIFGSLLGTGIYMMTQSRHRWVQWAAQFYRYMVRGTPLLVLLLFVFYVVLNEGNGIVAAVIAFSINFSGLACTMIQTSIATVGRDQIEAGRALGFTKMQNLRYIVVPQAMKNALPTFKSHATTMVKSTAVVGYVAIMDLTRAMVTLREGSGQSVVPLLVVTTIYFILAWLICQVLDRIAKKTTQI